MKQLLQDLNTGYIKHHILPIPSLKKGYLLVKTHYSLLSNGTERMLLNFGKGNLLNKALQQPEKVREVFDKAKNDGVINTINAVHSKLNQPLELGYSNVGKVLEVGEDIKDFKKGLFFDEK